MSANAPIVSVTIPNMRSGFNSLPNRFIRSYTGTCVQSAVWQLSDSCCRRSQLRGRKRGRERPLFRGYADRDPNHSRRCDFHDFVEWNPLLSTLRRRRSYQAAYSTPHLALRPWFSACKLPVFCIEGNTSRSPRTTEFINNKKRSRDERGFIQDTGDRRPVSRRWNAL